MFGFNGSMHSHYLASTWNDDDSEGFYVTEEDNEIVNFPSTVNCLEIFASDTALKINFNGDTGTFYIPAYNRDGISHMPISYFKILHPAGTKIKWRALVSIENT